MTMKRILVVSMLVALHGCAVSPTYVVGPSQSLNAKDAERAYLERLLVRSETGGGKFDRPVHLLRAPMPDYPQALRNANVQGVVRTRFTLAEDGRVVDIAPVGTPQPDLARSVSDALSRWVFEPVTINGEPKRVRFEIPFTFAQNG